MIFCHILSCFFISYQFIILYHTFPYLIISCHFWILRCPALGACEFCESRLLWRSCRWGQDPLSPTDAEALMSVAGAPRLLRFGVAAWKLNSLLENHKENQFNQRHATLKPSLWSGLKRFRGSECIDSLEDSQRTLCREVGPPELPEAWKQGFFFAPRQQLPCCDYRCGITSHPLKFNVPQGDCHNSMKKGFKILYVKWISRHRGHGLNCVCRYA